MTNEDLNILLEMRSESARIDYKESLNWKVATKAEKCQIVKDILAMANYPGGGKLIFGVRDADYEPIGLNDDDYNSFDVTTLNQFIHQYSDPKINCRVFKNKIDDKKYVILEINEFDNMPIICKKDMTTDDGKTILQKGAIYTRKESAESSKIDSSEEMKDVINRALKNRSDELLKSIKTLMVGRSEVLEQVGIFNESRISAKEQILENIGKNDKYAGNGRITLEIEPNIDLSYLNKDIFSLRSRMKASQVSYRGWTFPHENDTNRDGKTFNLNNAFSSYISWERFTESFVAYRNGLFRWEGVLWEDLRDDGMYKGEKPFSFIGYIYSTLEYLLFINKYYDYEEVRPDLKVRVGFSNFKDRTLVSYTPGVFLWQNYKCEIDTFDISDIYFNVAESISEIKEFSKMIVKKTFEVFNYQIDDRTIESWQQKFLSKSF